MEILSETDTDLPSNTPSAISIRVEYSSRIFSNVTVPNAPTALVITSYARLLITSSSTSRVAAVRLKESFSIIVWMPRYESVIWLTAIAPAVSPSMRTRSSELESLSTIMVIWSLFAVPREAIISEVVPLTVAWTIPVWSPLDATVVNSSNWSWPSSVIVNIPSETFIERLGSWVIASSSNAALETVSVSYNSAKVPSIPNGIASSSLSNVKASVVVSFSDEYASKPISLVIVIVKVSSEATRVLRTSAVAAILLVTPPPVDSIILFKPSICCAVWGTERKSISTSDCSLRSVSKWAVVSDVKVPSSFAVVVAKLSRVPVTPPV